MRVFPATLTPDKIKLPLIKDWYELATSDPLQIKKWQDELGSRITFWGVPCGEANGIVAVDFDIKGGKDGFKSSQQKGLVFPPTTSQRTMSGGLHLIYKAPPNVTFKNTASKYADGLDTRGSRGYIIYYGFDQTPMADAPQWLIDAEKAEAYERKGGDYLIQPGLARQILNDICSEITSAPPGEANNILNLKSFEAAQQLIGTGSLPKQFVYDELFKSAKSRGKSDSEARSTIESGFAGGLRVEARDICPFEPVPVTNMKNVNGWMPQMPTRDMFFDTRHMKRPQNFKDWAPRDVTILTADGGSGKTTLMLNEAVCLAIGKPFLNFECVERGNTLFITGEDTAEKLYAITGKIMQDMQLTDEQIDMVAKSIVIKKESDMCLVTIDKNKMIVPNHHALNQIMEAVETHHPRLIVIDPIAMFWGAEAALNDMSKAVAKFAALLRDRADANVVLINHMGKQSSQGKDLSQFSGRGGSALPSHARVVRTMSLMTPDDYTEKTGKVLEPMQYGLYMYVSKFSDGSPIFNVLMVLTRTGMVMERTTVIASATEDQDDRPTFTVLCDAIIELQRQKKYYTDEALRALTGISKDKMKGTIALSQTKPVDGYMIKSIPNPDITQKNNVYVVVDEMGNEIK